MKKNLLVITVFMLFVSGIQAQNYVFKDDFQGYDEGFSLADTSYVIWEGGAVIATGEAGNKFAKCQPAGNNFYLRKPVTLEVGKSYIFEVTTKSPDGKNHRAVAKLGERTIQGDLLNKTEWTKTTIEFTVADGEAEAILWVYSFPVSEVDVDDFMIYEKGTTKITEFRNAKINVFPSQSPGEFRVLGTEEISECSVYNINGKLIKKYARVNSGELKINLSDSPNGIYLISVKDIQNEISVKKIFR
jgi:hypothetical protein